MNLKPVCLLLSLCYASSAASIGLGELDVRSYLGQPLHATVKIQDPGATTSGECFSLAPSGGGITPPLRAQLSLEQAGNQTLLHIRTPQPINDPIAQFVLVSDCEARLQREYVVLLDPPARTAPPTRVEAAAALDAPISHAAPRPSPVRKSARQATVKPATAQRQTAKRTQGVSETAPLLVLSGRRMAHEANSAFALKLDTNLPDLTHTHPARLTDTELSDENTALTHKLAHLESQLAALQKRNAELDARRASASSAPAVPPPDRAQPAQWPLYLLIMGVLTAVGVLVVWLRRRAPQTNEQFTDVWSAPSRMVMPGPDLTATGPLPQPVDMQPSPERMFDLAPPAPIESTEVKDDILDQAEVYMAHGHGDLAVHLLQEHLREAPTESPIPWLLLLDLLHREGDTAGYAAASAECHRHFNIDLSAPPVSQEAEHHLGLEAYPHLMERLVEMWGTPHIDDFFRDLIYDNRGGTRIGFEPGAYRDILLLRAISQDVLPLAA